MSERMSGRSPAPFADRIALAGLMVARGARPLPVDVADQTRAAGREMHQLYGRFGAVLPLLEPERHWRQRTDLESKDETRALLLAGLLGCVNVCVHLRRQGPQPAFCRLPLRRVDCGRCVWTVCRPATGAERARLPSDQQMQQRVRREQARRAS